VDLIRENICKPILKIVRAKTWKEATRANVSLQNFTLKYLFVALMRRKESKDAIYFY